MAQNLTRENSHELALRKIDEIDGQLHSYSIRKIW